MYTSFSSYLNLLNIVFVHNLLKPELYLLVSVLIKVKLCYHIN